MAHSRTVTVELGDRSYPITIGSGPSVDLLPGDLLFVSKNSLTVGGVSFDKEDVARLRPAPGVVQHRRVIAEGEAQRQAFLDPDHLLGAKAPCRIQIF